jgi:hypothetical protein
VYLEQSGLTDYFEVKTPVGQATSPWGDWRSTIPPGTAPPA